MSKKILTLSILTLFFINLTSFSQGFGPGEPPKDPPRYQMMFDIQKIKTELGLTDEQVKKIQNLTEEARKNIDIKQIEVDKVMISIREELIKDNPNLETIRSLVDKKHKIMAEIETLMIKRDIDIKGILTKEQFEKFRIYFERRHKKEKRGQMMDNFKNRKNW